jgi:hypothetical protein
MPKCLHNVYTTKYATLRFTWKMPDAASYSYSATPTPGPPWTELRNFLASPDVQKRFPGFADMAQAEMWAKDYVKYHGTNFSATAACGVGFNFVYSGDPIK